MDLDVEVQNNNLDLWLENCLTNESGTSEGTNKILGKDFPSQIPEISESDVTSEIEKLTSAEDDVIKSYIGLTTDQPSEKLEDIGEEKDSRANSPIEQDTDDKEREKLEDEEEEKDSRANSPIEQDTDDEEREKLENIGEEKDSSANSPIQQDTDNEEGENLEDESEEKDSCSNSPIQQDTDEKQRESLKIRIKKDLLLTEGVNMNHIQNGVGKEQDNSENKSHKENGHNENDYASENDQESEDEQEQNGAESGDENESGEDNESEEERESGEDHESEDDHDSVDRCESAIKSGDEENEAHLENEEYPPSGEDEDDEEAQFENEDGDDMSSKISGSPPSLNLRIKTEKLDEVDAYGDNNSSILEPTCELAESEDYDPGLKSRFNLRKRIHVQSSLNTPASDEYEYDPDEAPTKKLKFNFHKKNYRRQRPYTNEAVKDAVKMVQSKKMSILEASRQFDIPRTSLHNFVRLYKRGRRMGIRTISPGLTKQEEAEMVSLVIKLSRCGKRYSHNELRFLIQYYLINNDRPVFKSGTLPTMGWIAGLVERQPELTRAKSKKNTKVAVEDVEEWQKQIEDYLVNDWDLDIDEIFRHENGHRIFCFNAFKMTINGPAENAENKPFPVKKEPGAEDDKDQEVSAILGMSADGGFVVPLIVLQEDNMDVCPPCDPKMVRVVFNKTGRVDEEVAMRVVRDFDEEIINRGIPKPVVFFVNDKQDLAHFSVIEYCWENQIVIICLPPKTCKTMTPFEVSIWPKIRSGYAALWKSSPKGYDNKISAEQFPELFVQAWDSAAVVKQAVRGFIKSGLIPLDVPAILGDPVSSTSAADHIEDSLSQLCGGTEIEDLKDFIPDELASLEDRSRGKLEGIQMCLEAIESFIPPDVIPVWNERGADYRGRCELAFKLWRSVSLLLKAGCAMASIQQMADGLFNPFGGGGGGGDFAMQSSFFPKTPIPDSLPDSRSMSPVVSVSSPAAASAPSTPMPKKRKLNKSIYSQSDASILNEGEASHRASSDTPFVKLYQNPFLMTSEDGEGEQ